MNIDEEWENFISSNGADDITNIEDDIIENTNDEILSAELVNDFTTDAPIATNIYISTKTKISYLNQAINLKNIFWEIPVMPYYTQKNGVIKKQIKITSNDSEELSFIRNKLINEIYVEEQIITHIDNPSGRIKFKDTRKISIGISKKDLMSYRCKKKSAFYNCFVLIVRIKFENVFKEFHVKIFNTGKLEIPGIQNEEVFKLLLNQIIEILQPYVKDTLNYKDCNETVLINSNFNCGFFINRETLYNTLKFKYNIQSIYDPCSYPGIQCKFYYNPDVGIQNGCQISEENKNLYKNTKHVSFMIFRTGSVLIVGRCDENVLFIVYEFLKIILNNEFKNISQQVKLSNNSLIIKEKEKEKQKTKKIRKRIIRVEI